MRLAAHRDDDARRSDGSLLGHGESDDGRWSLAGDRAPRGLGPRYSLAIYVLAPHPPKRHPAVHYVYEGAGGLPDTAMRMRPRNIAVSTGIRSSVPLLDLKRCALPNERQSKKSTVRWLEGGRTGWS